MQWLKELRLAAAARRLLTSQERVVQVAEAVGFANAFHFSREFSHRYGVAPSAYRDQQSWGDGAPGSAEAPHAPS